MLTYLCLTHSLLIALRFCFYPILSCVSLPGIIFCNTIYISLFTLCFDEIHLIGFYFVTCCFCINSYKNTRGFSRPPTINSRLRTFARNVDFSFIVSGSERTFTFRVAFSLLYFLLCWASTSYNLPENYT